MELIAVALWYTASLYGTYPVSLVVLADAISSFPVEVKD